MKLKGLVWFFTIVLIIISLWLLSYTWAVRSYESDVKAQAAKLVKKAYPTLSDKSDDFKANLKIKSDSILNVTKDKSIFPVMGTSYQTCKENELNLGLDLQGGLSVTMDVSLEDLLKSLSNNPNDSGLKRAIQAANIQKLNSDANYITLFKDAYTQQNGSGKLAGLFSGQGKDVKPSDNDNAVIEKLSATAGVAIKETYKILLKRIDRFGVFQPNINLDENKGIINVELAGVDNPDRVKKLLQQTARLQFWELYQNRTDNKTDESFVTAFSNANTALDTYLRGVDTSYKDTAALFRVMMPVQPQQDKNGNPQYFAEIARVTSTDTAKFNNYLKLDVVKNSFPANCKFILGQESKPEKGEKFKANYPVYAVRTQIGTDKALLEGDAVEKSWQDFDDKGRPCINVTMDARGDAEWGRITGRNVGRPVAISLDDIVYSAPNVQSKIDGGTTQITGQFTVNDATDLASTLQSGKVSVPAKVVASQEVGATLGADSVKGGAKAFIISFIVIFILMLVYYNTAGWVANIALILNLLFTVGVLIAFKATLTAAGIAGLVLTIGMAVDTNVIIFERIKEELTRGKSYQQAVADGYKRSLAPVIDAHVTTLLTAIILFIFGLGPVLGFATTQIIGILLSLFCGILVSRLITDVWTSRQRHFNYFTGLSKRIFKHANFKFIEYRKVAYGISIIVLLAGIGAFFNGFRQGVEFKGGRSYTVGFDQSVKNEMVLDDLKKAFDGDNPVIKTVGDNRHLDITTAYLKGVDNADSAVQSRLFEGLKKVLPANLTYADFIKNKYIQSSTTVQPSISDDLKRGAVKATIFAIIIIFIYIFIRFRDWRYSLGTIVALLHDVFVTLAVFSFFKNIVPFPLEIDQHFIAAVLTVIGFSMNDTVIVFDRIREYSHGNHKMDKAGIINSAINDTLSRTIMTSLTVFLTILILFIFGGEVTRGFAFAMLIGVITGTYSSIFVAAPILVDLAKDKPLGEADTVAKPVVAKKA